MRAKVPARMQTTVAIVDDHRLFRTGLRALLDVQPDMRVVGEAADSTEAMRMLNDAQPDVVILDIYLPGASGLEVARDMMRADTDCRVLALSMFRNELQVARALDAGAIGYASKDQSIEEVLQAVRAVAAGQSYLAPGISRAALDEYRRMNRRELDPLDTLTAREREVFDLTVSGSSTAEIAQKLVISKRTVETHRSRVLRKLNSRTASDLVRMAARMGLLAP